MSAPIRAVGVLRTENKEALEVVFNRRPTDDEMRAAHIMLRDLASELPGVSEMHVEPREIKISMRGAKRTLRILAAVLAKNFKADKGVNFVEYEVRSGERDFLLTLQRQAGLKPTQVIERVKRECDELLAALKAWQSLNVECFNDGSPAPREGCTCNACETWREGSRAIQKVEGGR